MARPKRALANQIVERKGRLITELAAVRERILDVAASLPPAKQDEVFLGIWSAKDVLAHLAGWDETNLHAVKEILTGNLPSFYSYYDRDWATYNSRLVAKFRREDFGELLASVRATHRELLAFLETVPPSDFERDRGIRWKRHKVTPVELLEVEKQDEETHYVQIKKFAEGQSVS